MPSPPKWTISSGYQQKQALPPLIASSSWIFGHGNEKKIEWMAFQLFLLFSISFFRNLFADCHLRQRFYC